MAVTLHSPLEQFIIKPIIPLEIAGIDVSFTQSSLWMVIGVVLTTIFMVVGMRKKAIIPGRLQATAEFFYDFVFGMVAGNIGKKKAKKYLPFVFSVFMTVFMGNVLGLLPYAFTYTSHIIVTGFLAFLVLTIVTIIGFVLHGWHFLSLFLPKGIPLAVAPLIIIIELVSYFSRIISLSVRLFANMVAGHTMMKVFASFSTLTGVALGLVPMLANVAFYGLETLVALIQTYIFTILTCVYLKDAVELH